MVLHGLARLPQPPISLVVSAASTWMVAAASPDTSGLRTSTIRLIRITDKVVATADRLFNLLFIILLLSFSLQSDHTHQSSSIRASGKPQLLTLLGSIKILWLVASKYPLPVL